MKKAMPATLALMTWAAAEAAAGLTPGWDNLCDTRRLRPPAREYWRASIADAAEEFTVDWVDGAAGTAGYSDGGYVIEKTNTAGYVTIAAKRGFSRPAGSKVRSFVDAEVMSGDSEYSLMFPRVFDSRKILHSCWGLDAIGIFMGGGYKMAYLVNTAPGVAERRFSHHVVSEKGGTNLNAAVVLAGFPAKVKIVDWGVEDYARADSAWVRERGRYYPRREHKGDLEDEAVFRAALASDKEHTARLSRRADGSVALLVDGREELPLIYKNPHSWGRSWGDYNGRAMARAGVRLQTLNVGENLHWRGAEWDRERALKDVEEQMRCSPDALYVLSFIAQTPREYSRANPSELMRHPDGTAIWGEWGRCTMYHYNRKKREMPEKCWPWISMSSTKYLADVQRILAGLIADLRRTGLSKRIVGIHICGWHDGQFAPYRADFSEPARKGFISFLRARGHEVDDSFRLPVPGLETWYEGDDAEIKYLFSVYQHVAPFRVQEKLARLAKRSFGKDIVTMHWAMGVWGGQMNAAHYLEEFCRSDAMDVMVAQPSYSRRLPGCALGMIAPAESFARHGKLYVDELDLRAYGLIAGYVKEVSAFGLGHVTDFPMWQSVNRRMLGRILARRQGAWYYDISGGFYNPFEITADIGDAARCARELMREPPPGKWRPSAAVVVDEKGMLRRNSVGNASCTEMIPLVDAQMEILAGSGVPTETWTAADAMDEPELLDNAAVVVLGGFFRLDERRRKFIGDLKRKGKRIVALAGFPDEGWRGFGIDAKARSYGRMPAIVAEKDADALYFASPADCAYKRWSLGVTGGDIANQNRPPSFSFEETGGAEVLARYRSDGLPAVVRAGPITAIGQAGALTPRYFNRLVREAGGYVPVEEGLQVDMNGGFLSVHALRNGRFDFVLPFSCRVENLKTAMPAEVEGKTLRLELVAGETCWFRLIRN